MQFGAFVPQGWRLDLPDIPVDHQWGTMMTIAAVAEETGFDSIWVYDHFQTFPDVSQETTWEAWTLMTGLAQATERVRLGQMCTCNSYRPPSYLAKVTACIDVLSGGRLEVGIGAGWYEHEYRGYGYEFPKPSVRIGMLHEAVQILRSMWTEDTTQFDGRYYQLDGAICRPHPKQDPHPPLWIAGGGEQLTLRVVARYGDYANFFGDPETFARKKEALRGHCSDVGRDPDEIRLTANVDCLIGETEAHAAEKLASWDKPGSQSKEAWQAAPQVLYGTAEQVAEQVEAIRDQGIEYLICYFVDASWGDSMRRFAEDVAPAFR
jgi:F420-dependent oxidoreductase-like protein